MLNPSLSLTKVSFQYKGAPSPALSDLDLTLEAGETLGIVGPNGAGKSTLLKLLVGLEMPSSGQIIIDALPLEKKNLPDIRRRIGYVFQDSDNQLFMSTVLEDVMFGPLSYGLSRTDARKKAEDALLRIGIAELAPRPIHTLSGGEKKLAALATVLSLEPKVLLFDEPTIALDPKNRRRFMNLLGELRVTKLIVTHDLDLVYELSDRVVILSDGRIAAQGSPQKILTDKTLLEENHLELPLRLQG